MNNKKADTVVEIIINRLLLIGGLKTYADVFLFGMLGIKEEAYKLY